MKFSTEAISKMAEIMVSEMGQIGVEGEGIRGIEMRMREFLREVGFKHWGVIWNRKMKKFKRQRSCVFVESR